MGISKNGKMMEFSASAFTTNGPNLLHGPLIDSVHKNAKDIFLLGNSVDSDFYSREYNHSTVSVILDLLRSSKTPDVSYALYPHVLFKDYIVDNCGLFGSVAILNVSCSHLADSATTHCPSDSQISALRKNLPPHWLNPMIQPRESAHEWELESVILDCIAMVAVVVSSFSLYFTMLIVLVGTVYDLI